MGNDFVPDAANKSKSGVLSSVYSSFKSSLSSGTEEAYYSGHPGADGSMPGDGQGQGQANQSGYGNNGYSNSNSGNNGNNNSVGSYRGADDMTTSTTAGGMVGMGNPNFKDARKEKSWYETASEAASSSSSSSSSWRSPGSGMGMASNSSIPSYPPTQGQGAGGISGDYNYSTNRGPNALTSNQMYNPEQYGSNTGSFNMVPNLEAGAGRAGVAVADGGYEKGMIESLCEPGGLKPAPPDDQLRSFLKVANTLSCERVGKCLLEVLCNDSWQSRAKGLVMIGALATTEGCGAHTEWWTRTPHVSAVRSMLSDSKVGVRAQASKTVRLLGQEGAESAYVAPARAHVSPPTASATSANLLDDLISYDEPAPTAVTTTPTSTFTAPSNPSIAVDDGASLFSGMSLTGSGSPTAAPTPTPPSASTSILAPAMPPTPPMVPSSSISSNFDFLNASESSSPPVGQEALVPVRPMGSTGEVDLFGGLSMATVSSSAPLSVPTQSSIPSAPTVLPPVSYSSDLADLSMSFGAAPSSSSSSSSKLNAMLGSATSLPMMMGNVNNNISSGMSIGGNGMSMSNNAGMGINGMKPGFNPMAMNMNGNMNMNNNMNGNMNNNMNGNMNFQNMNMSNQQPLRPQQQQYGGSIQAMPQQQMGMPMNMGMGMGMGMPMGGMPMGAPMGAGQPSGGPSGFSFLGSAGSSGSGSGSGNTSSGDDNAFSFVSDQIKALQGK